jgi:DNA processing protein
VAALAFAALEATGRRRLRRYEDGAGEQSESGEPVPPIALWVRGTADLASVGVRSVAIVGARHSTEYGEWVARDLAGRLTERGFVVVSGGAHGIDAAAHRGALSTGGETVLVSAGGLDSAYPPANAGLFDRVAESGLLVSESPPGAAPRRRRFLTRNRLIAALGTGTLVVEAALRSGALNTARHCVELGRPLMAVPGPVTSDQSAGCHWLIARERDPARLVGDVGAVLEAIGSAGDLPVPAAPGASRGTDVSDRLDALDPTARQVFDGFPARAWIGLDKLAVAAGLPPLAVIRALPRLELDGLVEASAEGYRIKRVNGQEQAR